MNIKQAKQEITDTLRAYLTKDEYGNYLIPSLRQRPVLLMGPPGIGKTQIMEQIAAETGVGLVAYTITHHTRQSAMGLPFIEKRIYDGEEYAVTEYTMSEILSSVYKLMSDTGVREGILFLDEINCVSETLAPMMLQFLQVKTFGNQRLPEGWLIVAAGNPPEYNRSVREFDVVTLDRVKRINVTEDFAVWKEYARQKGLHGAVIQYLDIKKDHFYIIEKTAEGIEFATARGWEDLSEMIYAYEALGLKVTRDVAVQYIQIPSIARDFANYLDLYYKYQRSYHIEEVLKGTWEPMSVSELRAAPFDEKLSVMGLIVSRLAESAREVFRQEALTDALYGDLKIFKERVGGGEIAPDVMRGLVDDKFGEIRKERDAGRLIKERRILLQAEAAKLEEYRAALNDEHAGSGYTDAEAAVDKLKELFERETRKLGTMGRETGEEFDNAFRYLEETFGAGQEMVIFVTEITAGHYTSRYVENYGCDAYFRYNRELLFDDETRRIREEIMDIKNDRGDEPRS